MKRLAPAVSFALLASAAVTAQPPLEALFEPGHVVEDRNGDGFADFVNAELILGDTPSSATVAAVSDVAARLGFETMAMNLPLTAERGGLGVAVGAEAAAALGVGLSELRPGEGLVTTLRVDGRDWLVVAGPDDEGTRRAATTLAGRLPHVWDPDGPSLNDVLSDLRESLAAEVIEPSAMHVTRIVAGRDALSELVIVLELPDTQVRLARRALLAAAPSYEKVETVVLRLAGSEVRFPRAPATPEGGPIPPRPGSGPKRDLDLSNLYTPGGMLGDTNQNHIADRIDVALSPAAPILKTADLAARLGLEAAGVSIPLIRLPEEIDDPKDEPTLVLIGDHPLLDSEKIPPLDLEPGEGAIRVVPNAFGPKGTIVVTGGDDAGLDRALEQLAERFPHIWERGKDRTQLDDVEMDLWRFFSGRSPAGQAAIALYKLDQLIDELSEKTLRQVRLSLSLEKPAKGFEAFVRDRARAFGAETLEVVIDDRDVQDAATIFEERFEIPSEVDELLRLFRDRALPKAANRNDVTVEVRVSEPPEVRARLAATIRRELGEGAEVRVLTAYKQGYGFLDEVVRPRLEDEDVRSLTIRFARYEPPAEWPQQAMSTPLRWLHEIFPIDEVLAAKLGLPLDAIRFEEAPPDAPAYEVVATGADGSELLRESFEPKLVLRPYIDRFRDYEMVNVTTGWITVKAGGETLLDQRIATDPERFWDHFQSQTIPAIYDYVMERHEGNPRGGGKDAPYFGELLVELSLSEPQEKLPVDREIVSPMDALHEDIYFTTLMFFRLLGRNARGEELTYPGRILPVMEPKRDGKPGTAHIRFTGFATSRPAVVVDYEEAGGEKGRARRGIPKIDIARPRALEARVRAGTAGLTRLAVRVQVDTERDEREELSKRARSLDVDERIVSAEQVEATLGHLEALRETGLYRAALAYHDLDELVVRAGWTHEVGHDELEAALPANGEPPAFPDIHRFTAPRGGSDLVQWDRPIPPAEAYGILGKMSAFDEATVYELGESYLGQEVWAMDLTAPVDASHRSRYKATTLKPTVVYSARQHANEVSSTSHVLKLAELLLTDPEERRKLDAVNVVIHPITNPDGAQLAYDLYRKTPDFLLHAGYYASLGMDVTSDGRLPMPIYPEAPLRRRLWETWLPDIFLNPHGYPSHQLVQLFSEYTGLVRRGRVTERNWSMNKGWFMPGFSYVDDPRYPRHKEAAFTIRDYITRAIRSVGAVDAMNQRSYDRYRRYGARFDDDEVYKLPMVDGVMIHTAIEGSKPPPPGARRRGYDPKVTIWSGTTEAPDETADGDWLKLVASAGLAWDRAILQYLVDGNHEVERKGERFWGGVSLRLERPRPPKGDEASTSPP